jgi:hypothetical protein
MKTQDYHAILEHILEGVYKIQKNGGLKWIMDTDQSETIVSFKMPVMLFLGDTEGQDKLVGRVASRINVPRLCRYCNIPLEKTDNQDFKFKYVQQSKVELYNKQNKRQKLKEMAQYLISNATHKLLFCDQDRGIHGACPLEVVHTVQLGWHVYALNSFFKQKKFWLR